MTRYCHMIQRWYVASTVAFASFIAWVIYTANHGGTIIFTKWINFLPYPDKWGHLFLFGVLSFLLTAATGYKRLRVLNRSVYAGALVVWLLAFTEEISQGFLASRSLDAFDFLADTVGVLLFAILSKELERNK